VIFVNFVIQTNGTRRHEGTKEEPLKARRKKYFSWRLVWFHPWEDLTFVFLFVIVVIVVKTNGTPRHEGGTTQGTKKLDRFC